jgi:hypothetical protein
MGNWIQQLYSIPTAVAVAVATAHAAAKDVVVSSRRAAPATASCVFAVVFPAHAQLYVRARFERGDEGSGGLRVLQQGNDGTHALQPKGRGLALHSRGGVSETACFGCKIAPPVSHNNKNRKQQKKKRCEECRRQPPAAGWTPGWLGTARGSRRWPRRGLPTRRRERPLLPASPA